MERAFPGGGKIGDIFDIKRLITARWAWHEFPMRIEHGLQKPSIRPQNQEFYVASTGTTMSPRSGFFERTVTRLLMRPAKVSAVVDLSPNFRLIDFEGEALRDCKWEPGDKVQIKMDGGLSTRTYTPIEFDQKAGTTRILAYCHDQGPGSRWARSTTPGEERQLFGPRTSLSLAGLPSRTVLFGDETSIGLAIALQRSSARGADHRIVIEANDREETAVILDRFGLAATLVQREPDESHGDALVAGVMEHVESDNVFILSGHAPSIQKVSRAIKAANIPTRRIRTKAYWAPGKTGID